MSQTAQPCLVMLMPYSSVCERAVPLKNQQYSSTLISCDVPDSQTSVESIERYKELQQKQGGVPLSPNSNIVAV